MKAQKKAKKTGKAIQRNINDQTAFKKAQKAGIDIRDIEIRPYSASPSKLSRRGNNEKFRVSPERQGMIREQEEKLENMQAEMERLRTQHASAFKPNPGNIAGSVRDFTGTSFTSSPGKQQKYQY